MLNKIQAFFENHFVDDIKSNVSVEHQLNLATAALLIEMVLQDDKIDITEIDAVKRSLVSQLNLSTQEAEDLYALAEEEKHHATDYHQFTNLIAKHYSQEQKIQLIESLWQVAFADNVLDKYEEHMVRKICDLIHVSHKDFIRTKHRAENK